MVAMVYHISTSVFMQNTLSLSCFNFNVFMLFCAKRVPIKIAQLFTGSGLMSYDIC